MARWHKIENGTIIKTVDVRKPPTGIADGPDGNPVWRPEVEVGKDDPVGPDQVKEGPVQAITPTSVTMTWTVRNLTAQELADRAVQEDRNFLLEGLLDLAEVVIIHIDAHLAKGNIAAADFNAATRQKYIDLKERVDRLRGT